MIVVGILIILVSLAIPNMLRANITANEAVALANTRHLYTALQMYYYNNNKIYPRRLRLLIDYVSQALSRGRKSGYLFNYTRDSIDNFHIQINPRTPGRTGERYFYTDETGIVTYSRGREATKDDPAVE